MRKSTIIVLLAVLVVAVGIYALTLPAPIDVQRVRAYSDAVTEDILRGLNEGNYTRFSGHFDSNMKGNLTEVAFLQMKALFDSRIGEYSSKEFVSAEQSSGYIVTIYKANFTSEPAGVTVKAVFSEVNGTAHVTGLWFDSPKLRS